MEEELWGGREIFIWIADKFVIGWKTVAGVKKKKIETNVQQSKESRKSLKWKLRCHCVFQKEAEREMLYYCEYKAKMSAPNPQDFRSEKIETSHEGVSSGVALKHNVISKEAAHTTAVFIFKNSINFDNKGDPNGIFFLRKNNSPQRINSTGQAWKKPWRGYN